MPFLTTQATNGQQFQYGRCLVLTGANRRSSKSRLLPVVGRNVVCRDAEIELRVLEVVEKRIIPVFGPRLQRQAKLLHEGCSIKLNVHGGGPRTDQLVQYAQAHQTEKTSAKGTKASLRSNDGMQRVRAYYDCPPLLHGLKCARILLLF